MSWGTTAARVAAIAGVLFALSLSAVATTADARSPRGYSLTPSATEPYASCAPPKAHHMQCMSIVVPQRPGVSANGKSAAALAGFEPSFSGSGEGAAYGPADLRAAYGVPTTGGSGQTVAIVDAFDDPNAEADLAVYRERYGLSSCTTANGCFKKVNQTGGTTYPGPNGEWATEISLDLDMVSAACQACHILLVEANNNEGANLFAAENEAVTLGATEISNSWGGSEEAGETAYDSYFNHPGIPITVSSGDSGYEAGPQYPAASPYVIAVGGTRLVKTSSYTRGWYEEAWFGAGSGCSAYESKPSWQTDSGCAHRTIADVSAVAAPETPLSMYDTYSEVGWMWVGGTSASAPFVAGLEAMSSSTVREQGAQAFYNGKVPLFDMNLGTNAALANCTVNTYLCDATAGYDGPTGNGTPNIAESSFGHAWATARAPHFPSVVYGVSCASATSCASVGVINHGLAAEKAAFSSWNGTAWTAGSVQVPSEAAETTLSSISCWASEGCVAVGGQVVGGVGKPLAEKRLHGNLITTSSLPEPAERVSAGLTDVACPSSIACVAVGFYSKWIPDGKGGEELVTRPFSESWNGTSWTFHEAAYPSGKESKLTAVSCPVTTWCEAVGESNKGLNTLAEVWNGSTWTIQTAPTPEGAIGSVALNGMSCFSASACTAVGTYQTATVSNENLALRWNGSGWSLQTTPQERPIEILMDVSCPSASACTAIGIQTLGTVAKPLALSWNGSTWTKQAVTIPAETGIDWLLSNACPSTTSCMAVGYEMEDPTASQVMGELSRQTVAVESGFAESWNGTSWSAAMSDGQPNSAAAVSCYAQNWCVEVGASQPPALSETLLTHYWNGAAWSLGRALLPSGASASSLAGVSCGTYEWCVLVGNQTVSGTIEPLVEAMKGRGGIPVTVSEPTGRLAAVLTGASCVSASACMAVGTFSKSVSNGKGGEEVVKRPFAERWDGTAWSLQELPYSGKEGELTAVSCASATSCEAVGTTNAREAALAEVWNGSAWTVQTMPTPEGFLKEMRVTGVSCTTTSACTAVGSYTKTGVQVNTLAERWNGSAWSVQATPNPGTLKEGSGPALTSVSCTSTKCLAAGSEYNASAAQLPMVLEWNGAEWSHPTIPAPSGAHATELRGVSCVGSGFCLTIGIEQPQAGTPVFGFADL